MLKIENHEHFRQLIQWIVYEKVLQTNVYQKRFLFVKNGLLQSFSAFASTFCAKSETWRYKYWIKCNDDLFYGKVLNAEVLATSVLEHFDSTTLINKKTNSDKSRIRNTFLHFAPKTTTVTAFYGFWTTVADFLHTAYAILQCDKVLTKFVDKFSFVLLFAGKKPCLSFANLLLFLLILPQCANHGILPSQKFRKTTFRLMNPQAAA